MGLVLACLMILAQSAGADILSRVVPNKWTEQVLPENEPEPYYPEYTADDPLAQAQIQINAGQYRRALVTLIKVDAAKSAFLRGQALADLGRYDAALGVLTATDAPTLVLRADLLGRLERYPEAISLLQKVAADQPQSIPAHFYLGWYLEKSGDFAGRWRRIHGSPIRRRVLPISGVAIRIISRTPGTSC